MDHQLDPGQRTESKRLEERRSPAAKDALEDFMHTLERDSKGEL
jgi:hypothetical protein